MSLSSYLVRALWILVALEALAAILSYTLTPSLATPDLYLPPLVNGLGTSIAYAIIAPSLRSKMNAFMGTILGGMAIKMLSGIAVILLFALYRDTFLKAFVILYFLSYIIFTTLEVVVIMRNLRTISKEQNPA